MGTHYLDIISNSRRRRVLGYLKEYSSGSISEVSLYVAVREHGKDLEQLSEKEEKRVYVGLYQVHLPRLEDAGLIQYDVDTGEVTIGDEDLNRSSSDRKSVV